jgi:hypothetical protein
MSDTQAQKGASEIPVRGARFTFLWPLSLQPSGLGELPAIEMAVQAYVARLIAEGDTNLPNAGWKLVSDPIAHLSAPAPDDFQDQATFDGARFHWENDCYAEAVYFHEFVRSFLFPTSSASNPPFHLFQRQDAQFVEVTIGTSVRILRVERINLYLFRLGVAILVVEVATDNVLPDGSWSGESGWSLAEVQTFADLFRRTYAPYYEMAGSAPSKRRAKLVPDAIRWMGGNRAPLTHMPVSTPAIAEDDLNAFVHPDEDTIERTPPIFTHWRSLLDTTLALPPSDRHSTLHWSHVVDERMPIIATVVLDDTPLCQVRAGEFMRLCFVDSAGKGDFPYDETFLSNFEAEHAYDRFRSLGTRYLVSGYSLVAIAEADAGAFVWRHMRRHYFQMALLANLELASLLAFSTRISDTFRRLEASQNRRLFDDGILGLQEQFSQFAQRFRFTGVTNQLQGIELYNLMRRNMGLDRLFAEVRGEIENAASVIVSRAEQAAGRSQSRLNLLATIAVVIGLPFALLSSSFLFDPHFLGQTQPVASALVHYSLSLRFVGLFLCVGGILLLLFHSPSWRGLGWLSRWRFPSDLKLGGALLLAGIGIVLARDFLAKLVVSFLF